MMKVLLINNFPPKSGIGRYIFSLFRELQLNDSIDCFMLSTYPMDISSVPERERVSFLKTHTSFTLNRFVNYFLNPHKVPRKYDIYHISNQSIGRFGKFVHPSVVTVYDVIPLKRMESLPPGAHVKDNHVLRLIYDYFVKKSVRSSIFADKIICPSSYVKQDVMHRLGVGTEKIHVVAEGVDHNLFKPREKEKVRENLQLDKNMRIVLHVGNESDPRKNITTLLRALYKLSRRLNGITLIRVGRRTNEVSKFIEKLGLKVLYYGDTSDEKLAYLYNAADVYVLPSYEEGTPTTALEAMSSGCPTIVSKIGGNLEMVGDAAALVDPFDIDGLAHCMGELLTNEVIREDLTKRALRRSMVFSWKKCAEETVEVYKNVLRNCSHGI